MLSLFLLVMHILVWEVNFFMSEIIKDISSLLPNAQAVFAETTCATDGMTLTLRYPEEEK